MTRTARALLVVSLLTMPAAVAENASVRGQLLKAPGPADRFTVHLTSLDRSFSSESAFVAGAGSFQFPSVPQGNHMLEVRNFHGENREAANDQRGRPCL